MKRFFLYLALMSWGWFLVTTPARALAIPEAPTNFFVADYADVLKTSTEDKIFTASRDLAATTGAQIVVVTIPDLQGQDIESFATDLFRTWEIGDQEKDSGLLILLAVADRRLRVEVGYGLEGILPDGKVGRITDEQMIPALKLDDWDGAVWQGYQVFQQEIVAHAAEVGQAPSLTDDEIAAIVMAIIIIIWLLIALASNRRGKNSSPRVWRPFIINNGSFGGGSFGGGGGGFSGGGGSSGGGGASRSF